MIVTYRLLQKKEKMAQEKKQTDFRKVIGTDAESVYDILEGLDSLKEE